MKGSFNEYESEIDVFDSSDSDICDERDNETIDFVAPNELVHNIASLNPYLHVDFDAGNESDTEFLQKKEEQNNLTHSIHVL